ncbi:MAG: sialate O-acetylesterase [Acidobacteriaceae bacterium]
MHLRRIYSIFLVICLLWVCFPATAEVTLPELFTSHMVLQRNKPVHVWGMAAPDESVTVTFRGETKRTDADALGRWSVYLAPGDAGGPFMLTVKASNTITLNDVLVGDVWIASGQSNMEFPMTQLADAKTEIAAAKDAQIRLLRVEHTYSDYPLSDVKAAPWTDCNPDSVASFSAVAYFFARDLQKKEHVPIGLIESSWGGTVAEAWTSMDGLSRDASLMPVFAAWARMSDAEVTNQLQQREIDRDKAAGKPMPNVPWKPVLQSWEPAQLYNGMIAPLTPLAIRGVIWYQGESNSKLDRAPTYSRLFPAMIQDWRRHWGQGNFPFLFVQISSFTSTPEEDWATIREAQRKALSVSNTAMAVTIDIGNPDNVHPKDKQDVGARLALAARATVYGEHDLEYSGPLFRQATQGQGFLRVWFSHAENGLVVKGGSLKGFEVAGADGKFVSANAKVEGSTVIVTSTLVAVPKYVRYGWANSPECNLYNKENLPASPFTSVDE